MLDLINRLPPLVSHRLQPCPDEQRTSNVIALNPRFAALTSLYPGQLLEFAVKLLNRPTDARLFLCGLRRGLSDVVGGDIFRPVGRHRNPKQFHLSA